MPGVIPNAGDDEVNKAKALHVTYILMEMFYLIHVK